MLCKEIVSDILNACQDTKGQLIWKANCQVMNSSKKGTNEFIFTTMRRVFVSFWKKLKTQRKFFEIH